MRGAVFNKHTLVFMMLMIYFYGQNMSTRSNRPIVDQLGGFSKWRGAIIIIIITEMRGKGGRIEEYVSSIYDYDIMAICLDVQLHLEEKD